MATAAAQQGILAVLADDPAATDGDAEPLVGDCPSVTVAVPTVSVL